MNARYEDAAATLKAGRWFVTALQDEDGHLCLIVRNADGSPVLEIDSTEDDDGPEDMQRRFTTQTIEADYHNPLAKVTP